MEKKSFIYSLPGRLLRGFLCMVTSCAFVYAVTYIMYGVFVYGDSILDASKGDCYENSEQYQTELLYKFSDVLGELSMALEDETVIDEVSLLDVSTSEVYVYDLAKIHDYFGSGAYLEYDVSGYADFRKSYSHYDGCNITDYESARKIINDKALEDSYIYFSDADFRAFFVDQGIPNKNYQFSEDFPEDAYFLFDYKGSNKTARKELERIASLGQLSDIGSKSRDNAVVEHNETRFFDLTDLNYAVYIPNGTSGGDLYYSTRDDYFESYPVYVYKIAEVRDWLNELDKDGTRFDSIIFPLLLSENQTADWMNGPYDVYDSIFNARNELAQEYSEETGQFYFISGAHKMECSDAGVLEEIKKEGVASARERMTSYLSGNDYIFYIFSKDGDGKLVQETNGTVPVNDSVIDAIEDYLCDIQCGDSELFVYGFYNGDHLIDGNTLQYHIRYYSKYVGAIKNHIWLAFGTGLLTVFLIIWLMATTGRRYRKDTEVSLNLYDKMPTEIWFIVTMTIISIAISISLGISFMIEDGGTGGAFMIYDEWNWLGLMFAVLLAACTGMTMLLSLCRRIKARDMWRNSILYRLLHLSKRRRKEKVEDTGFDSVDTEDAVEKKEGVFHRIFIVTKKGIVNFIKLVKEIAQDMKGTNRLIIIYLFFAIINIFLTGYALETDALETGAYIVIPSIILQFVGLVGILLLVRDTNRLTDGVSEIVKGNLDYKIKTDSKLGIYKELTNNINHIGDGLKTAIETSVKDERMKTELITNVSHDLKTPLTSIINYINLLKTEKMPTPEAEHYVEVLDSKAQRLKQLTEDLVEAAKATSGNIELTMTPLTFNELMNQSIGEFEDKFHRKELLIVANAIEEPVKILADGRRIYRVLENVFQNVYKYAMPGTRVYIDLGKEHSSIVFTVKNVSEAPLNISAEELMERFTRGDESRTTEGSGLGLSIAKDLTCLQGGTFDIILDGDLFKVVITFPELKEEA